MSRVLSKVICCHLVLGVVAHSTFSVGRLVRSPRIFSFFFFGFGILRA